MSNIFLVCGNASVKWGNFYRKDTHPLPPLKRGFLVFYLLSNFVFYLLSKEDSLYSTPSQELILTHNMVNCKAVKAWRLGFQPQ
ncbi:MAG: hypothetical protein AAB296_03640, partial [Candidatus Desantisbacteria bacterium]